MTFLPLLKQGAGAVGLDDDIAAIEAIVAMAHKIGTSEWPGDFPGVAELLDATLTNVNDAKVTAAFATLGIEPARAKVAGLLGKVQKLTGKVPEWVKTLLTRIDSFATAKPGDLSWKPLNADEQVPLSDEYKLALGFKAAAEIGLTAGAKWPGDDASPALLRLGAGGSASAKAGATIPYSLGTVGVQGDAGVTVNLDYYYATPLDRLLVIEAAERLPLLANPFDFASVWEAAQDVDFKGAVFAFKGTANAQVDVALAFAGGLTPGVNLDLGATLTFAAKFASGYNLTVARGTDGSLDVAMTRSELNSRELGLSIGVDIALPVVTAKVQEILTKAVEKWDDVVKEVTPFLSPGTLLQGAAVKELDKAALRLVADDKLNAAIKADAKRLLGVGATGDSDIADWLTGMLKGALDAQSAKLLEQGDAAKDSAVASLLDALPSIGESGDAELRDKLTAEIDGLVGKAKTAFTDQLGKLVTAFTGRADDLGKALKTMGAQSNQAVASVDQALKPVREILEKYNTLLKEIVEKVKEAAGQKISIAIQAENKRLSKLDVKLVGSFTAVGPESTALYGLLTAGRLEALADLIRKGTTTQGFALDAAKSSVTRTLGTESSTGFEFLLFGMGATMSAKAMADAEVVIDGNGNIAVDTSGSMDKRFSGDGQEREVSFTSAIALALTRAALEQGGATVVTAQADFGVNVIYKDKALKRSELDAFVTGLIDSGLVPEAAGGEAIALLGSWVANPGDRPPVDMAAKLLLSGKEAETLLRLGQQYRETTADGSLGALTKAARRDIFNLAWQELTALNAINIERMEKAKQHFDADAQSLQDFIFAQTRESILQVLNSVPGNMGEVQNQIMQLLQVRNMLHGPATIIDEASRAYKSTPGDAPGEWGPDEYVEAQQDIVAASRNWLRTGSKFVFWARDGMHPRTIALMRVLGRLAGASDKPVKLILTHRAEGKDPVTVLLAGPETGTAAQ